MDRSTFDHSKSGDTNPKGRWRSWLLEPYTRSLPSGREEKSRPPSFCRLRRQTALWYTLDEDQGTEREVRNCPPKRVRSNAIVFKPAVQIALTVSEMLVNLFDPEPIVIQIIEAGVGELG